jgi:hypothetical protein
MFFVQMPADVMFLMSRAGSSFVKTRHTAAQLAHVCELVGSDKTTRPAQ